MVIKKLIAISVVFALVAGAAFAVDLGGEVFGTVDVARKQGTADATLFDNFGMGRVRLEGSGEAEIGIGTIGGWMRLDLSGAATGQGKAWWQPIEQLRIQLGVNSDGEFDTSHIGRYGFYAQANEINDLVNSDGNWGGTSYDNAIFGGYSGFNFALIITPMDGVSINIALPTDKVAGVDSQAAATFKEAFFQVNYNADFGAIHVTYQGLNSSSEMGAFYASAFLGSLVENLGLEVGLRFGIAAENAGKPPLGIALGAKYDVSEQFGVKLRSIFQIPMESGNKVAIRVDLLPYYAINESVTAFLDAGIYIPGEKSFAWHVAPYVRIGSEWGAGFYAGLQFAGSKIAPATEQTTNLSIPIGIIAKF